ncbi:calcium channel protein [Apophysomyces sp. BC1021]|nr:calcium channel protein [Apophysomyces sp. BC1021]
MSDSESLPEESDTSKRLSAHSKISPRSSPIPQITLTEAASTLDDELPTSAPHSLYTLSPTVSRMPVVPQSPHSSIPPLPLTRDLLQRKNKLDRILHHDRQKSSTATYSSRTAVDERITAGLGISSPQEVLVQSGMSSGPRSAANSVRREDYSQPSSPRCSGEFQFPWNYDPLLLKPSTTSASSGRDHKLRSATSSVTSNSGSSMRNATSLKDNHMYNQYMERDPPVYAPSKSPTYPTTAHSTQSRERASKNKLLNILYNAAARVVNSCVSENTERFNMQTMLVDTGHVSEEAVTQRHIPNQEVSFSHTPSTEKPTTIEQIEIDYTRLEKADLSKHQTTDPSIPLNVTIPSYPPNVAIQSPLQGYSLRLFSPVHPLRLTLWKVVRSRNIGILPCSKHVQLFDPCASCRYFPEQRSLETSWELMLLVSGFIFFFLLLFALVGLISFQGVFSRRCYVNEAGNEPTLVEPPLYCSGFYNENAIVGPYNPAKDVYKYPGYNGYICVQGQICMEKPENNPNFGFVNYDTIFYAFLSCYTFVSLELWTELMYQTQDGDSTVAALYFCLGVYVISFVLTFLLFAVITSAFARVRAENSVSAFTAKKKQYPLLKPAGSSNDPTEEEPMWMYEEPQHDSGLGVTKLKLRRLMVKVVKSRSFFYFGGLVVLLDLAFMCVRSVYVSEYILESLDNIETAFTFVFAIEIVIRMVGATSWMHFWTSGRNKFDLFLVITTCVIQLPVIQDSEAYKYLTIFQCLRTYRLFLCLPRVRRILAAALGSGESITNVVVFLVLATALCSPIFMLMFGGDFGFIEPNETELRFDTFWQSFVTLIMLYTSETWTDLLYNSMESQPYYGTIYAAIFVSIYFAFGRYIMSGLYIAVILENFELEDDFIKQYQIKHFIRRHMPKSVPRSETFLNRMFGSLYTNSEEKNVQIPRLPTSLTASMSKSSMTALLTDSRGLAEMSEKEEQLPHLEGRTETALGNILFLGKHENTTKLKPHHPVYVDTSAEDNADDYDLVVAEENRRAKKESIPTMKSLLLFSDRNKFRYWCKLLVGANNDSKAERRNIFNWFIMACVLLSILMVILDEPSTRKIRTDTIKQSVFDTIDIVLSLVFVVEVIIRIIAYGFIFPKGAYLRSPWNQLDFCVVLLNFIMIFVWPSQVPRGLTTIRSLRILRLIRYFTGIREIFADLFHAFPLMLDALVLTFLVLIPFAVYGVNIFGGRFWLCNDDEVLGRLECVGEYLNNVSGDNGEEVNILVPRVWQNPHVNAFSYDSFPLALSQLFTLTSTEAWVDSMFSAMSTPSESGMQPTFRWDSPMIYHSIFYVVFMIVSHGTVQLFIGVIIEKFKQRSGISTLTLRQRQYLDLQRQLAEIKPTTKVYRPNSRIRGLCYDLVADKRGPFSRLMMGVVILNICVIASEFQNEPLWLQNFQDYSYFAFIVIYVIEVIIKCLGLGWKKWSKSKWNWYDSFIAVSALILLILRFTLSDLWTLRMERYCLVFAAFRLGEGIDALQTLYHTVGMSMPSIIRVSAVFMLVMCLFAMIFMEFFGLTKYGPNGTEHSNFRDYGNALLLLVRMTTGEGWVIISNFEYAYETRTRFTLIAKSDLRRFKHAWAEVDPFGTGYIQKKDVAKFLHHLHGRLRLSIYDEIHSIRHLRKLGLKEAVGKNATVKEKGLTQPTLKYNMENVERCLAKINPNELQRRRKEYNLHYMEIVSSETGKGISFADVLTIMAYRFINIEESLTLDPLIARLEKIEQLNQAYAVEKACGVFLTLAQRKRYLHQLWQKRNEEELTKLGIANSSNLISNDAGVVGLAIPQHPSSDTLGDRSKKRPPPVPRIVVENVPAPRFDQMNDRSASSPAASLSIPVSPMSFISTDSQPGSPFGADSLSVVPGTSSLRGTPSPNPDYDESILFGSGGLSPYSISPSSRQNWLLIDGNASMSSEQAESLLDSLEKSPWSDMLHDEK